MVNRAGKLLRPTGSAVLWASALLGMLMRLLENLFGGPGHPVVLEVVAATGIGVAFLICGRQGGWAKLVMRLFLALAVVISFLQTRFPVPYPGPAGIQILLVSLSALLYGSKEALSLVAVVVLVSVVNPAHSQQSGWDFLGQTSFASGVLAVAALLFAWLSGEQRRRLASLRDELYLARTNSLARPEESPAAALPGLSHHSAVPDEGVETLDDSIRAILVRIRGYLHAHSVLLYQLHGSSALKLRLWASDAPVDAAGTVDLEGSLIGRIAARGISCNWNLDDPNCGVTVRDIPYYTGRQPVRNLAGCPLRIRGQLVGILVVDRDTPSPFTELEVLHVETFAIQLVEMIEMGKRYLEQVDRNMEYRLFYRAVSELAQSLATDEILSALARACEDVVAVTHTIIALLDKSGLSYEIGLARGAEQLTGSKVKNQGRTWISWLLNSDTGPLLLKDIRSHVTRMPVASPREEDLPVRSVLLIPLVAKGRKIGALLLGSTQQDYFQNWHMRILADICRQAAANIENSLLHRRVENEALSDGLTHLFNHRYFQEHLKTEISRARRNNTPLALLMADIDHFKKINDTYGHRIGDVVLGQVADILKRTVRSEDAVARYGGEEFAIILTGSGRKGAIRMAERLRAAAERVVFQAEEHGIAISISIGVATYPDDAREPWELIECADRALYGAKKQGRNRVVAYDVLEAPAPPQD